MKVHPIVKILGHGVTSIVTGGAAIIASPTPLVFLGVTALAAGKIFSTCAGNRKAEKFFNTAGMLSDGLGAIDLIKSKLSHSHDLDLPFDE